MFKKIRKSISMALAMLTAASGLLAAFPVDVARAYDTSDLATMPLNLMVGSFKGYDAGKDVDVSGDYAYLADNTAGLQIVDIHDKSQPVRTGNVAADVAVTRVAVNGDTAYIVDGKTLKSVDIADPVHPAVLDSIGITLGSRVQVAGDDVWVVDGSSALRVIDASDPEALTEKATVSLPGIGAVSIGYVGDSEAYLFDGTVLSIVDISDPQAPAILGQFTPPSGHYADLYATGDHVYMTNTDALISVNVADPAHPIQEFAFAMDNQPTSVYVSGDRAYVGTGGGSNKFVILDLTNPAAPSVLKTSYNYVSSGNNWYGVNTNNAVKVADGYAYLANRYLGLTILDLDKGLYVPPTFQFRNHDVVIPPVDLTAHAISVPAVDGYHGTSGQGIANDPWDEAPAVWRLSDAIRPGELATAYGEGMTQADAKMAFLEIDGANPPAVPPAQAVQADPADVDGEGQTITAILPDDLAPGSYYVWVRNQYGWSAPAVLNGARPQWVTQDEAAPGLQVGVVGKGLDAREFGGALATRVLLSDGTQAFEAPLDDVNPFKITFRIPNIAPGDYDVLVSNDGIIWRQPDDGRKLKIVPPAQDPLGLGVSWANRFVWDLTFNVADYGADGSDASDDSVAIQAALNAAGSAGGGVVYIPDGNYVLMNELRLPARTVLEGQSRTGTVVTYANKSTTGPYARVIGLQNQVNPEGIVGLTNFTLRIDPKAAYDYLMWIGNEWGPGIDDINQRTAQYMFVLNMNLETSFNRLPVGRNFPNVMISKGHNIVRGNNFTGYANTFSSSWAGEYGDLSNNDFYTINSNVGLSTYMTYENNYISRNPYAATNEDTAQGIWGRGNTYFADNYVENTGQPTSNDGEILAVESYRGGTKMYGDVADATALTITLDPFKNPDGSLRGSAGINNMDIAKRAYGEWQVLIVRGRGLGQLRKIASLDQATQVLTVDRPWDILPDRSSRFVIYNPNKGVIIYRNTVVNGAKGLWLYGQNYDGAIVGNTGTNVEGAFISSIQGNDRLDTNYFHRLENNTFTGGGNKSGLSGVGVRAQLNAGGTFGYIAYGISEKGNTVQHVTDPAVLKDATEAPNISGIYAVYESTVQQPEIKTVMKAVTIEGNTVNDVDRGITVGWGHIANAFSGYPFSSGILIKDNQLSNVGVNLVDPGSTDTTLITPIPKDINLIFKKAAFSSSDQSGNTAGNAVDGDSGTVWTSAGGGEQWLAADMGRGNTIRSVHLDWGSNYAIRYNVQVSDDAEQWTDVYSETAGNGGEDDIALASGVVGRYVRVYALDSSGGYYSVKEMEAMGIPSPVLLKAETTLEGNKIRLTFDKSIAALPASPVGFAITASLNGSPVSAAITGVALNSDDRIVELTMAAPLPYGAEIEAAYVPGTVQTVDGGQLAAFSARSVANLVPAPPVPLPEGTNLIGNPGFEAGMTSWIAYAGGTLSVDTGVKHSGDASGKLADRTNTYSGPGQPITDTLYNSGPGTYSSSSWVRLASGEDTAKLTLKVESTTGTKYFALASGTVDSNGFAQISGTIDVAWTGGLIAATVYAETASSKAALYVDDVSMVKASNDASLSPTSVGFDKNTANQADVTATIQWRGASQVTDVKNGSTSVGAANYSVSGNTLTIKKAYLAAQPTGHLVLTVSFDEGRSATLTIVVSDSTEGQTDPFLMYLTGESPPIVADLGTTAENEITVRKLVFHSRTVSGVDENVYAIIARPTVEGSYPGILYLHGGAGFAEEQTAISWAKRGYIAMVLDEPGIADPTKVPNSTGPWTEMAYGSDRFVVKPDITSSTIFGGVVAGLNAFKLLSDEPGIQQNRIGITGISWGGYLTTMLSGLLGDKVKAAYSIFGTGYFDKGTTFIADALNQMTAADRAVWLKYLDAGRRAAGIQASYFVAAAARDHFFWPPAVSATLQDISGYKNQAFAPTESHQLYGLPGGDTSPIFFDYYLKGIGNPFPTVQVESVAARPDGGKSIIVRTESAEAIESVTLYYSMPNPSWESRLWNSADAVSLGNNRYEAVLPAEQVNAGADWYVNASDSRPVTAGTLIYNALDDSFNPVQISEVGGVDTPGRAGGVAVIGHYAYIADNNGVQVVDIANPAAPALGGYIPTSANGTPTIAASGSHIYFADRTAGINKLYAYDVSNPENPVKEGQIAVTAANRLQIEGNLLYVFDGGPGVRIIDISNPASMRQLSIIAPGGSVGTGYVSDGLLYLTAGASAFKIYDVSNPSAPVLVGSSDLTDNANGYYISMAKAGHYIYIGDGSQTSSKLLVYDVSDPVSPARVSAYPTTRGPQDIVIDGNYAFVGYYNNKLEALNISDPAAPSPGNSIALPDNVFDLEIVGDTLYAANSFSGLKVLKAKVNIADHTAPVSVASISPAEPNGSNGWYASDATVSLSATDDSSGVARTEYRINDGEWTVYSGAMPAFGDGVYTVAYRSADEAGNVEEARTISFQIDKTAPQLSVQLDTTSLWPPNHKMATVHATLNSSDAGSGVASVVLTSITSNEPDDAQDDIQANFGTSATSFQLRAERSGNGTGRLYTVTYTITDHAGNQSQATATVSVPHNR